MWAAIATLAEDQSRPVEIRQAARLDMAHEARRADVSENTPHDRMVDSVVADSLADMGVAEIDRICIVVSALSRVHATILAVVDLWLEILPEVAVLGADWLDNLESVDM